MINLIIGLWNNFVDEIAHLEHSSHEVMDTIGKTPPELFRQAGTYWITILALILVTGVVYKCCMRGKVREAFWRFMDRKGLKIMFLSVWSMGFIVYCAGGYSNGFGMLSVVFMSLTHATEMFVGRSDIGATHYEQHENAFYMFIFGLTHFLALLCSLMFVIRQIGFFFVSKVSAMIASYNPYGKKDSTYVFWGINEASLLLAESIHKEAKKKGKDFGSYRLIFVRTLDNSECESEGYTPENLYDRIKVDRREMMKLRQLGCMVVSCSQRLSTLRAAQGDDILRNNLGLYSLCRIIKHRSRHTHIFMIGEDEDANIKAVLNLKDDLTVKNTNTIVDIYCHSRKSAKTRSLEYYGLTHADEHTDIHIIDTSALSVNLLRLNAELHPVRHVEINKNATVDSPFNAMIVGFGETGQEALRFLYEYGAFINSNKQKSPFHCTVFDRNMEEHKGFFLSQTPFFRTSNEVTFHAHGINTSDYWKIIEDKLIRSLDYIVICPGNDALALETASNLCSLAMRHRTDESPRKLTICIRSYAPTTVTRLQDFCSDINEKYQAYGLHIVPFGKKEEIFTYDQIINDRLLKMAMEYNYAYEGAPKDINPKDLWIKCMGYENKENYCIDEIEEIERKCKQNFSNVLHGATKLYIIDKCSKRKDIPKKIRENMARLEHERWVACMHVNGWQRLENPIAIDGDKFKTRLTTRRLHTDICPWEEIRCWDLNDQRITQGYDYKVLDTTLKLLEKHEHDLSYNQR